MSEPYRILCDDAELAVDCARHVGRDGTPELASAPLAVAADLVRESPALALTVASAPRPAELVRLATASRAAGRVVPLCVVGEDDEARHARCVAGDLGLVAVPEVAPLACVLRLLAAQVPQPWSVSTRALQPLDRRRLGALPSTGARAAGRLVRADDGLLAWAGKTGDPPLLLGAPQDVGVALRALHTHAEASPPARAVIPGVDRRAVQEVIFGPPRALSDPASKTALEPYGLPLPMEELCTSPSRAASEAARIGFPARISLASPDLRLWDHPDLAIDGVDNAARVRDVYRQIMAMATERQPDARLLGVHVTATTTAAALLRVEVAPLPDGYVHARIGFADPHGRASRDETETVLPASPEAVERVLSRLAGASLVLGASAAHRKASVAAIADALLRLAAFVDDLRNEIERVELHPLALLVGASTEVREACVTVGDSYVRTLEARPLRDRA